jgi:hypothetical protein
MTTDVQGMATTNVLDQHKLGGIRKIIEKLPVLARLSG